MTASAVFLLVSAEASDAFIGDARVAYVNRALEYLRERMAPDETLAVLPEGVMLNYLLRRRAPTPYINYMPPELRLYGEPSASSDDGQLYDLMPIPFTEDAVHHVAARVRLDSSISRAPHTWDLFDRPVNSVFQHPVIGRTVKRTRFRF